LAGRGNVRVSIKSTFDDKGVKQAEGSLGRLNSAGKNAFLGVSKGALGAGAALIGAGGLVEGIHAVVEANARAEVSQKQMETQLRALGISYKDHAKEIEDVIQRTSRLSGLTEHDLTDSFTNLVRATGSVDKALRLTATAADLARAKHLGIADAGQLLGRVLAGNTRVLKSLGISFTPVTAAQDKLKESTKHASIEQVAAAKAADKQATAQKALGLIQDKVKGQAAAYGKTTQGAMDRASASVEHLEERLGKLLAPTVAKVANGIAHLADNLQTGRGNAGKLAKSVEDLFSSLKPLLPLLAQLAKVLQVVFNLFTLQIRVIAKVEGALVALYRTIIDKVLGAFSSMLDGISAAAKAASHIPIIGAKFKGVADAAHNAADKINGVRDKLHNLDGQSATVSINLQEYFSDATSGGGGGFGGVNRPAPPKRRPRASGASIAPTAGSGVTAHPSSVMASAASAGPMASAASSPSKEQIAQTIVAVGRSMGASDKQILAAIEAGIVESGLQNLPYGDRDSVGVFQQRPSQGWTGLMNVPKAAAEFFRAAMRADNKGLSPGQLAQAVQRSAFPGRYDAARGQAQAILGGVRSGGGVRNISVPSLPKPKPKATAFDKLQNRLDYIGLQEQAGVISTGTADQAIINAVKRALPHLSGADRLRALAARREAQQRQRERQRTAAQTQRQQAAAGRQARTVNRTIDNPWLQAYLTHQDYLARVGWVLPTQDASGEANANKTAALRGALPGLRSEADKTTALGMIADLQPAPADTTGATSDNTDSIDANTRALEQTNALLQQQIDVEKERSQQLERALAVAQSEERTLGRSLANQLGITFGIRAGMNKLLPTVGASQ
jgi:hypothetical protein